MSGNYLEVLEAQKVGHKKERERAWAEKRKRRERERAEKERQQAEELEKKRQFEEKYGWEDYNNREKSLLEQVFNYTLSASLDGDKEKGYAVAGRGDKRCVLQIMNYHDLKKSNMCRG